MTKRFLRTLVTGTVLAAVSGGVAIATTSVSNAADCSDVQVVFARGTGELPGLGITGGPFTDAVKADLPGLNVTSYAVEYAADALQASAGAGATDMSEHVESIAAQCPGTKFVLGGYSQGASVVDIAIGIPTALGTGGTIPAALAPNVAAVAVFGNPLRLFGQNIPQASQLYGPKAIDLCNTGDPVCGNGANIGAHLTYGTDGSATTAAQFAAGKVTAAG
jgi:cutinase